ncbi:Crp/Fnr family transcriptional regulator [Chryseolinea lacunae]|uniref:Crp/Fnr family transcriptional regulator n=1 Tax=Chryseolinea lacunae TaxID=2801331 RepID=A0ABS1L260_9BACT|nr:Crp/Fnr family transcriptional regulator [Chryseolinea lacunae]MBL0745622.1 Crp/Fnr family transcriptional regulator [Chryseolinea lacunae]
MRQPKNTDLILSNVARHIRLDDEEERIFISFLHPKTLKRKEVQLKQGDVCTHSAFIIDGALKGYTVDKEGGEHVINFAVSDWWIADMYSLISQKPGILTIEALADSEVLLLAKDDQQLLFEKVPKFERFFRILIENSLVANQQRLINNLTLSAEERYQHFMTKYPFIMECAPLHSIASYLGMTPEFLSKIRRRMAGRLP